MSAVFDALSAQQDYAWFLAGLAWTGALACAYGLRPASPPAWVRWSAAAAILSCAVSIEAVVRGVDTGPSRPVHLPEDLLLAAGAALQAAGWGSLALRPFIRKGWVRASGLTAAALGVVSLHFADPRDGGLILALATAVSGLALLRRRKFRPPEDVAVLLIVLAACASPIGPIAYGLHSLQRWTELSPVGIFAAALLGAAAVLVLTGAFRRAVGAAGVRSAFSLREEVLPLAVALGSWLVLGLVFSWVTGRVARADFERSAVGRVSAAAALLNTSPEAAILDKALGPAFKPVLRPSLFEQPGGSALPYSYAASLMAPEVTRVVAQLARIARADPDAQFIQIETIHRGRELTVLAHYLTPEFIGAVAPLRDVSEAAQNSWRTREAYFEGPVTLDYGDATFARAPLVGPSGRMLGWLTFVFGVSRWESVQAEARLLSFSIVALGLALGIVLMAQKIRARERHEALQAAAAADEANRMKTRFLANVSHELRTPIQAIMGYTELLRGNVTDDTARARILLLRRQGELMTRLVNDLIDLAALESGAFRFVDAPLSLATIVIETVEGLRPRAQAKGIGLQFGIGGHIPAWIEGDSDRIGQIVMNLVGNAIKFTDSGRVDVFLHGSSEGETLVFELRVADTGPGIPAEEFDRLFMPFSRLSTSHNREGAGLGLALSAALCRSLGGDLTASSDGRTGSVFTARLRLRRGAPPPEMDTAAGRELDGARILVADDNRMIRELFTAYLSELGAACETASDGREALEKALAGRFQAIVLDLAMPKLDGHQVARELRSAGRSVRIVGVSAHAGASERINAGKSGMDEFLTKPVDLAALARALQLAPAEAMHPDAWRRLRSKWETEFRSTVGAQIDGLGCAMAAGDWDELRRRAHHLRNSAIVLRDERLFEAFGTLEDGAAAADEDWVRRGWALCASALERWHGPITHTFPGEFRPGNASENH